MQFHNGRGLVDSVRPFAVPARRRLFKTRASLLLSLYWRRFMRKILMNVCPPFIMFLVGKRNFTLSCAHI